MRARWGHVESAFEARLREWLETCWRRHGGAFEGVLAYVCTLLVTPDEAKEVLGAWIVDVMGGTEPDIALECTGAESLIEVAIEAIRFNGMVFVLGVGKGEMTLPFMRMSTREVDVVTSGSSSV